MSFSDWKEISFSQIASYSQGKQVAVKDQYKQQKPDYIRFLRIVDYINGNEPIRYVKNYGDRYLVDEDDLIMIRYGSKTAGKVVRGYKGIIGNNMFKISFSDDIDLNYMYFRLSSNEIYELLNGSQSSSTMPAITFGMLNNIKLLIPRLPEQKAIAATLSCLDSKIKLNNKINRILEEMALAIFKSWFVDFEPFRDGEFEDSELGRIPKGWRVGEIGDYVKVKSGYLFKSAWWKSEGIPVVKIKEIDNGTINFSDISYVSAEKAKIADDFKVKGGDLLIAMTGATIGKLAIVPKMRSFALVNQRVGKFFLGDEPIKKLGFLYCILKQDHIYGEIVSRGDGSAQPNISSTGIETIKILLPPDDIIWRFNQLVQKNFELLIENAYQNAILSKIRDTLLPKLMSGEIRVPMG